MRFKYEQFWVSKKVWYKAETEFGRAVEIGEKHGIICAKYYYYQAYALFQCHSIEWTSKDKRIRKLIKRDCAPLLLKGENLYLNATANSIGNFKPTEIKNWINDEIKKHNINNFVIPAVASTKTEEKEKINVSINCGSINKEIEEEFDIYLDDLPPHLPPLPTSCMVSPIIVAKPQEQRFLE